MRMGWIHQRRRHLEYDIRAVNSARAAIPGPFAIQDDFPADVTYVPVPPAIATVSAAHGRHG